jgi:hypothetical protein
VEGKAAGGLGPFDLFEVVKHRMSRLLGALLGRQAVTESQLLEEFMVLEVVPAIQRNLVDAGFAGPTEGTRAAQFMIGLRGQLFTTAGDFTVGAQNLPWQAIGSGRHHAYGALHVLADFELPLEARCSGRSARPSAMSATCGSRSIF